MFTGIIQGLGRAKRLQKVPLGLRLLVSAPGFFREASRGDSIAVDGVCLTIESLNEDEAEFFLSNESLERSSLGSTKENKKLNLEKSLRPQSFMGGHWVQGHVDAKASIESMEASGESHLLKLRFPSEFNIYLVEKGSISLNGVSLTLNKVKAETFEVCLIPETWKKTNLSELKVGDSVNMEVDILAKYVQKQLNPERRVI